MEGNKKLYYVLMAAAVVLLMVSYGVGFVVGKNYGYNSAKKEFEVEKQKLLKTIASLTPLSRPKPEEKVVVVNGNLPSQTNTTSTSANVTSISEKKVSQSQNQKETKPETKPEAKKQVQVSKTESKPTAKPSATKKVKTTKNVKKVSKVEKDYYIQVGVFSKRINAEKVVKRLKKAGIPYHISKWKNYYRVTAGMFTKKEAEAVLKKFKKMKFSGIIRKRR